MKRALVKLGLAKPAVASVACLAFLSIALAPLGVRAQDFPAKPIRVVVPWPPGSNVDITARTLATAFGAALGTAIVVDNKPGAGGTIGTGIVAKAPADGYTLLLGSTASVTIAPSVYKTVDFDPIKDLVAIGPVHNTAMVLTAAPKTPVANYREFLALAAGRAGQLSIATPGTGSTNHLAVEMLSMQAGIKLLHVPYKGAGPALNDLTSSQVEMMMDQTPPSLPHIKEGRIKGIAVTSEKRLALLPDVPTLDELGLKGFQASTFTALFGPAGIPPDVLAKLVAAHAKAMADPKVRELYIGMGAEIIDMNREQFALFVKADFEKWLKVVKAAGITAE